jgi:hypothetical protein
VTHVMCKPHGRHPTGPDFPLELISILKRGREPSINGHGAICGQAS